MEKYIATLLNELDIKLILNTKKVEGELTYYKIFYKDSEYRNFCLELFYNKGELFYRNPNLNNLLKGDKHPNLLAGLKSCRKELSDKELSIEVKKIPNKTIINNFITNLKNNLTERIMSIDIPNVVLIGVDVELNPTSLIIVKYVYNRKLMRPIKFFLGEHDIKYINYEEHCKELIENIEEILEEVNLWIS